jgi:hypothetical protein
MKIPGVTFTAWQQTTRLSFSQIIRLVWVTFATICILWLFVSYQARGFDETIMEGWYGSRLGEYDALLKSS